MNTYVLFLMIWLVGSVLMIPSMIEIHKTSSEDVRDAPAKNFNLMLVEALHILHIEYQNKQDLKLYSLLWPILLLWVLIIQVIEIMLCIRKIRGD